MRAALVLFTMLLVLAARAPVRAQSHARSVATNGVRGTAHAPRRRRHVRTDCRDAIARHDEEIERDAGWSAGPAMQWTVGAGYGAVGFQTLDANTVTGSNATAMQKWSGLALHGGVAAAWGPLVLGGSFTRVTGRTSDGTARSMDMVAADLGIQCACARSNHAWRIEIFAGYDLGSRAYAAGVGYRSIMRLVAGLYAGVDLRANALVDPSGLASGSLGFGYGVTSTVLVGYSLY